MILCICQPSPTHWGYPQNQYVKMSLCSIKPKESQKNSLCTIKSTFHMKHWLYLSASKFLARENSQYVARSRLQVKLVKLEKSQGMTGSSVSIAKNWSGGKENMNRTRGNVNLLPIKGQHNRNALYYFLTANESHCYKNNSAFYKPYCIRHAPPTPQEKKKNPDTNPLLVTLVIHNSHT